MLPAGEYCYGGSRQYAKPSQITVNSLHIQPIRPRSGQLRSASRPAGQQHRTGLAWATIARSSAHPGQMPAIITHGPAPRPSWAGQRLDRGPLRAGHKALPEGSHNERQGLERGAPRRQNLCQTPRVFSYSGIRLLPSPSLPSFLCTRSAL